MRQALWAGCAAVAVLAASGPAARAADQDAINKAVDSGVAFLRGREAAGGDLGTTYPAGAEALVGLALLECDVKADDPAVHRVIENVRKNAISSKDTYSLSVFLMFLDRLGDPADEPLIQSIAVRLLGGQAGNGGWGYTCPDPPESEVRRLTNAVQHPDQVVPPDKPKDPDDKPTRPTPKDLPKEILDQIARINAAPPPGAGTGQVYPGDNSNTQLAALALWVARRHGLPVDRALARVDQRFRAMQHSDGGWAYLPPIPGQPNPTIAMDEMRATTPTMTCAGLVSLAVARGPAAEAAAANGKAADVKGDAAVKKGLAALGTFLAVPFADGQHPKAHGKTFYFLWSLERLAVILDLDKIGDHEWFSWGADFLVDSQAADGSWHGEYPPAVDTSFALLFLKRANVARDLTQALKGVVTIKSGVGPNGTEPPPPPDNPKPDDGVITVVKPKPPAEESEGGRLARELAQAPAERGAALLGQYKDAKGVEYTEALAGAIPQLGGEDKGKARDALAERLTRMKPDVLTRYFQDPDAEIRRAAALAAAMKEAKSIIPDLIPLLSDPEPAVAHAAHAALKDLTGEKLGPTEDEWKAWWKNRDR